MKEYSITQLMIQESVQNAIKIYGLEGTDEAIKRVYKFHSKIQELMLNELWTKIKNAAVLHRYSSPII